MKATELMIGDWVYYNKESAKVTILSDKVSKIKDSGTEDILIVSDSQNSIEPIPLTAEILKNNEFVISEIGGLFWQSQDTAYDADGNPRTYVSVLLRKDGSIRELEVSNGKHFYKKGCDGNNVYVHNLQHALKQCNIEKKIFI